MKNLKAPFLVIALLLLLNVSVVLANNNPLPAPTQRTQSVNADAEDDCDGAPCPLDFPIDKNIAFLLVAGLALGAVVVYKNQIKKASI